MNEKKFQSMIEDVLSGKSDKAYDDLIRGIHCMSAPRAYAVINAAVSSMDEGELYTEIGTYQGGSLIAALRGNTARAIGVDSFSEFQTTNNYDQTRANLDRFGVGDRVELRNADFRTFFASAPADLKIQVYYYDGQHDYEGQLAGMEAGWNFLAPNAVILVDDYFYPPVQQSITQFMANHKNELRFQFLIMPHEGLDMNWWNGIVVMRKVG